MTIIPSIEPILTQGEEVIYEPWTNGYAIGFRVTHMPTNTVEYIYINPSDNDDNQDSPNVFIYQGLQGDPSMDGPVHHYTVLEEVTSSGKGAW